MGEDTATMVERMNDRMARSDLSSKMHRFFYRLSGGRMGGEVKGVPVLLFATEGRRSKKRRTVPLMYQPDGDRLLVVASQRGRSGSSSGMVVQSAGQSGGRRSGRRVTAPGASLFID